MGEVVRFALEPASRLVGELEAAAAEAHEVAQRVATVLAGVGREDDVSPRLHQVGEWAQEVAEGLAWRLEFVQRCDARFPPIQAVTVEGMTSFVIPFDSREEAEAHAAGAAHAAQLLDRLEAGDVKGAQELLDQVEGLAGDRAWLGGFMRLLGPGGLDGLEAAFATAADKPRGGPFGWALDVLEGAWESITSTLGVLRDLSVQVVYDPGEWAADWGALASNLWEGIQDPGDFLYQAADIETLKANPAKWLGGLAPDLIAAVFTGGVVAASRGARGAARFARTVDDLKIARHLDDLRRVELRPGVFLDAEHVFRGEISRRSRATGFHHRPSGGDNARVVSGTESAPDRHGVYEAVVEIRNPDTGEWVRKDRTSTFFPDDWSADRILDEIAGAFEKRQQLERDVWEGISPSGVTIRGYLKPDGSIPSAFPVLT